MNTPENAARDQAVIDACIHYMLTGDVKDELLEGFDQHGQWVGVWEKTTGNPVSDDFTWRLQGERVNPTRMVQTDSDGKKTLLGTFKDDSTQDITIDYHHVKGAIFVGNASKLDAPNLKTTGDDIHTPNISKFTAPNLETVTGHLYAPSVDTFDTPNLEVVHGDLKAFAARNFNTPKLKTVEGNFYGHGGATMDITSLENVGGSFTTEGRKLNAPHLKHVGGDFKAPEAKSGNLTQLESVGADLCMPKAAYVHVPKLNFIGGDLHSHVNTEGFHRNAISLGGHRRLHQDEKPQPELTPSL